MNIWIKFFLTSVITVSAFAHGQPSPGTSAHTHVQTNMVSDRSVEVVSTDSVLAREQWKLSEEEWIHYETVMASPRGKLSPNITPIQALGVTAQTDAERQRYALMQAELQVRRDYDDLLWQAYVNQAKESPRIQSLIDNLDQRHQSFMERDNKDVSSHWKDYLKEAFVFVNIDCLVECRPLVLTAINREEATRFIVSGAETDRALRDWAQKLSIPPALTQQEKITLHHAANHLKATGYGKASLPLILGKTDDGYEKLPR